MPSIELNGAKIYFEDHGQGEETIVFAHGLLWSGHMFAKQVEALGFTIGSGYGPLKEKSFRIGHMGDHVASELPPVLDAIEQVMR